MATVDCSPISSPPPAGCRPPHRTHPLRRLPPARVLLLPRDVQPRRRPGPGPPRLADRAHEGLRQSRPCSRHRHLSPRRLIAQPPQRPQRSPPPSSRRDPRRTFRGPSAMASTRDFPYPPAHARHPHPHHRRRARRQRGGVADRRAPACPSCCTRCGPTRMTEAHKTDGLAELVCSNSFRSDEPRPTRSACCTRRCGAPAR